ncbi:hypothetical protein SLEP1_g4982 [Rubroshorea leprosula]|uniref:PGG domain-containing protein n=1 Tax=Rubroshorea leprosula TaxID=152421 RepID=A0AAV5HQI1_9ROSI|nr:hypothetical protein SLEP1_g4982 [Rubroshorea leprosula]
MAMTNTSSATMIVPQLLKRGNYKSWSIFMEDYLISQELWDGIIVPFSADQPLAPSESEQRRRNAAALNAIKISCGPESFVCIKYTRSAKDALDMLAEMHKTEPETDESTPKASNPPLWVSSTIVPELLERGNYERWSIFVKNYLVSQDLWVVTHQLSTPLGVSKKEWRKKNAAALHTIQISCGPEKFNQIKKMHWAIEAWDKLKRTNIEEEKSKTDNSEHEEEDEDEDEEEEEETPKINAASMIVPELLASHNYKRWSICMRSYLVSQDLWDAVLYSWVPAGVDKKEWIKKDAAVLHAIQISCTPKKFDEIGKITSAKIAWNTLKQKHIEKHPEDGPPLDFIDFLEKQGLSPLILSHHWTFIFAVCLGFYYNGLFCYSVLKINSARMTIPVPELLASDNYKRWSIYMKSYLVSLDLWDAVLYSWVPAGVDTKEWIKKDGAALHAIQISCTPKKFDEIKKITSAKTAWDTLKQKHIEKHPEDSPPPDFIDSLKEQGFQTIERPQSLILQNAIDEGDVNTVMDFFRGNRRAENLVLWIGHPTLHYATIVGKSNIVKALLESTPAVQKDIWGNTALVYAALYGSTEIAKYLVSKDSTLLSMEDNLQQIPVATACRRGHKEVTNFLYSETPFKILLCENGKQGSQLLTWCFSSQRFDIMFDVLYRHQNLIDEQWKDLLNGFTRTPTAFSGGSGLTFWQRWIYECLKVHISSDVAVVTIDQKEKKIEEIPLPGRLWRLASFILPFLGIKQIHALKLSHGFAGASLRLICEHLTKLHLSKFEDTIALRKALTRAIENDIYDFFTKVVETNANSLLAPLPAKDETTNSQYTTILHVAGKLASNSQLSRISGAALQMQREIQWFKEVESLLSQRLKDLRNNNGETAYQVLAREHKSLLKEAEDWMKGLANSYIIVGALIVTIMFAAAFTLPGGNDENKGFPIFKNKAAFLVYIISDAISLFAAAASVIIFLGFLTSRYNMEDFQTSIPKKLMAGLSTLFVSLAAMMIAFCSAIFLMLENRWWIIIPSVLLAGIPVSLFAWLQFPLLVEIYVLTYRSPIFSEKRSLASKIKAFFSGKKKIE